MSKCSTIRLGHGCEDHVTVRDGYILDSRVPAALLPCSHVASSQPIQARKPQGTSSLRNTPTPKL